MNTTFILSQTLLSATPLLLAGFGELFAQRAGVINIGIEGSMLMGSVAAFSAAVLTGSSAAAIPAAIAVGLIFAALFALATIWLGADQIVTGTALNIFALGASTTAFRFLQLHLADHPLAGEPPHFDLLPIPLLSNIPFIGPTLFTQYALFYILFPLAILLYLANRTRLGLVIRALGDAPAAADAAGIRVRVARTLILLFAGACSGLAGSYLSTMRNHTFQLNMTSGQGFLVLALVIFGRWNLLAFIAGTLAFSLLNGLQSYLTTAGTPVPRQLFDMLPYAATLIALAFLTRSRMGSAAPIYLGRPWPE